MIRQRSLTRWSCILSFIIAFDGPASTPVKAATRSASPKTEVTVPFVGCKSDGQVGPIKAPRGRPKTFQLPASSAQRLAYYKAEYGLGVLAPRGWYCFSTYGPNGSSLYVSPTPIHSANFFSSTWKGFTGPAIQLSLLSGDTSGRFAVARTIARVFPAYKQFVKNVIAEKIEPASNFPLGPYPKDKLTYRSPRIVEYLTPADSSGMGTDSWLLKNYKPIRGVAILMDETPDLSFLSVRLPQQQRSLTSAIIQQVEYESTH